MKIIARIFLLPFIIFPPLMGKMWFPKYWNKMKELAKKQYEIEKAKIEKEYEN